MVRGIKYIIFCFAFLLAVLLSESADAQIKRFGKRSMFRTQSSFKGNTNFNSTIVPAKDKGKFVPPPPDPDDGGDGDPVESPIGGAESFVLLFLAYYGIRVYRNHNNKDILKY